MRLVPHLQLLSDGRFEGTCGRCMEISQSVTADDAPGAWSQLVAMGWSLCMPEGNSRAYAICQRCSVTPWSFEKTLDKARKARNRK